MNRIKPHKQFTVGTWRIMPFRTIHDAREPLGFLLANQAGERLLFCTDSACVPHRFRGLVVIAVEVSFESELLKQNIESGLVHPDVGKGLWGRHMSLETAKRFFAANDMSKVQEIHLLHLSDHNSDADRFKQEIQKQTGRPVYIAEV